MPCANPEKVKYRSRGKANNTIRAFRNSHGRVHAYPCGGHWHIGHGDDLDVSKNRSARRTTRPDQPPARGGGYAARHDRWS